MHKLKFNPDSENAQKLLDFSNVKLLSKEYWQIGNNIVFEVECCSCGKQYKKASCTFGKTRCQCFKTSKGASNFKGIGHISSIYFNRVKERAIQRNIEFNITPLDILEKYQKQEGKCALTGLDIIIQRNYKKYKLMTASLDRVNSKKSYTKDNIQWVHKDVNRMKNVFDQKYFIEICKLIVKNNERDIRK